MSGLFKHPDGSLSRVAAVYDSTQLSATVRLANGVDVPVIDFHTREGERGQMVLPNGLEILSLDVSPTSPWSFNGSSGVVNGRRNYVPPGGPVTDPTLGWSRGVANGGGGNPVVSANSGFIQVANSAANNGVATKTFSLSKGKRYTFSVVFQNGGVPGNSYYLTLGSSKYNSDIWNDSQASGVVAPVTRSITFTAQSSSLHVAMGNQNTSASNISLWSVPTLVKAA